MTLIVLGIGLIGYWLADRGPQPFAPGPLFVAAWLAGANLLFPTQVRITPTAAIRHRKTLIGSEEESINIAQIASVKIRTHLLWSDVIIESSGGTHPIVYSGHWNRNAGVMQQQIETGSPWASPSRPSPTPIPVPRRPSSRRASSSSRGRSLGSTLQG